MKRLNKKNQNRNITILKKFILDHDLREKYLNRICKLVDSELDPNPRII